jgi:hypothetical protein
MKQLESIISNSINYLQEIIDNDEFLKFRSFYGDSFSLCLMKREAKLNSKTKEKLISRYRDLDKEDSEFHFEFNNYAFFDVFQEDKEMMKEIFPLKFKNTSCTNWTLLRNCTKLKLNKDDQDIIKETKEKLEFAQDSSGLILDDPGVKSFQYHCFSAAMIGEIYFLTKDEYFLKSFNSAVSFIRNFILPNGKALHIGRGQEQTFGYGALVYILSLSYKINQDSTCLSNIKNILNLLQSEQREDGSIPLVIGAKEPHPAYLVSMSDEKYCGWYPYNNFYDYLPFMAFFLSKANTILKELGVSSLNSVKQSEIEYRDSNFIKVVRKEYTAIISKAGGYWSNDQVTPLIYSKGEILSPVYGGEQFQESLYSSIDLGVPFVKGTKLSLRFKSKSFFWKNCLFLFGPLGLYIRRYDFKESSIVMKDIAFSFLPLRNTIYSFNESSKNMNVSINRKSYSEKISYSASGKLKLLQIPCWVKITLSI